MIWHLWFASSLFLFLLSFFVGDMGVNDAFGDGTGKPKIGQCGDSSCTMDSLPSSWLASQGPAGYNNRACKARAIGIHGQMGRSARHWHGPR
jgi:hypothetical protein